MRLIAFWVCLWIGCGRERNQTRKALRFGAQAPLWETPAVQEDEGSPRTPLDAERHARCFTSGFLTVPMKLGLTDVTRPAQVHTVSGNLHHDLNVRLLGPAVFCPFCPSSMDTFGRVCFFFSCSQLHSGSKGMVGNLLAGCQGWGQESVWAALAIQMFHSIRVCGEGVVTARLE